jgi:hypothetical protein
VLLDLDCQYTSFPSRSRLGEARLIHRRPSTIGTSAIDHRPSTVKLELYPWLAGVKNWCESLLYDSYHMGSLAFGSNLVNSTPISNLVVSKGSPHQEAFRSRGG